jgi:hypothetical protein
MQLQRAINIIYHVIRRAVIRWLLPDKESVVSRYVFIGGCHFIYILQHVREGHICTSILAVHKAQWKKCAFVGNCSRAFL